MNLPNQSARSAGFYTLGIFVLVVAILKAGQEVLVPIALAILLTFLLSPFVVRMTRAGLPKFLAILITASVAFSIFGSVGWLVIRQATGLAQELPNYENNIRQKIARLKSQPSHAAVARLGGMVEKLQQDVESGANGKPPPPTKPANGGPAPVPVEVAVHHPSATEILSNILGPVVQPLGTAILVIVFVITMMFQREDLRDRFINVISAGRLNLATQAMDDAAHRVTRYLLMQLLVNCCYGVPVGVALHFIQIPHALLWGVLATLLRFIPFVGAWIAAVFPIALAAAIDPGWAKMFYVLGIFGVMELVTPNAIEPWLYGKGTGISNLALLIAAVFWTWLWGAAGLFLSTPLTVCIMVLGKYVTGLQFLSVLLGSEPVLEPAARLYQRMLSMDLDEMMKIAKEYTKDHPVEAFYNDILVPALFLAEQDRHAGTLAEIRQKFIFDSSRELIDVLEQRPDPNGEEVPERGRVGARASGVAIRAPLVFGVAARDDADEVVAQMLEHVLRLRGIATEIIPAAWNAEDVTRWIAEHKAQVVFISALPPSALLGARQLCRRLKETRPQTKLVVGVWDRQANFDELKSRLHHPTPDAIVTNFPDAVRQIESLLNPGQAASQESTNDEMMREAKTGDTFEFPPLSVTDVEPEELLNLVTRDVAQHLDVPVSLVAVTTTEANFWKTHIGVSPEESKPDDPSALPAGVSADDLVVVEDITKDRRFASIRALTERGVRFYASAPLRNGANRIVGRIRVLDTKPRDIGETGRRLLATRAAELMKTVEASTPSHSRDHQAAHE